MNVPPFDALKKNNIISPPKHPNCPSDPPCPLFGKYHGLFPRRKNGDGNMTTHLYVGLNLRMSGSIPLCPICLHALGSENFARFPM